MDNSNALEQTYFEVGKAEELTTLRIWARGKRRLTYDCMNAVVQGKEAVCKLGHEFKVGRSKGIGMGLLSVLRGRSSSKCQKCTDFDCEMTE